jgi:hypothetical protein
MLYLILSSGLPNWQNACHVQLTNWFCAAHKSVLQLLKICMGESQ